MFVNSIFKTVQGEGKSLGKEVTFLRLGYCNFQCSWCDTAYTWDFSRFNRQEEIHKMSIQEVQKQLIEKGERAIVVSGGEPLIQQKELVQLFDLLPIKYWIEIETNASYSPSEELVSQVNQFNCSPKLSNSGMKNRLNPVALKEFAELNQTTWKFVISSPEDIYEVIELVREYSMRNVYLMAEGKTKEELEGKETMVKLLCKDFYHGFTFTPRMHITELGGGRLV